MGQIFGLYGASGSGKTRLVEHIFESLTKRGVDCRGVYSPAQFEQGCKVGILARLIPSGETKVLARLARTGDDFVLGKWKMFPETIEWAKCCLAEQSHCGLWIVDEIGPYEIEQNQGWVNVLSELKTKSFKVALITYRPRFQQYFAKKYPAIQQFDLEVPCANTLAQHIITSWFETNK